MQTLIGHFFRSLAEANEDVPAGEEKCVLFGPFSYIVQGFLALLSFSILVVKRYKEVPRRPWKVWFFDVSKQICSSLTQHLLNLFLSVFLSTDTTADECIWYFLNFFLDTTIGILICWALKKLIDFFVNKYQVEDLKSGYYFEEIKRGDQIFYKLQMKKYILQLMTWLFIITINKLFMLGLNHLCKGIFETVGNWLLKPFVFNYKLELVMVMIVFPFIFNCIQFWVFDEILKFSIDPLTDPNLVNPHIIDTEESQTEMTTIQRLNPNDSSDEQGPGQGGSSDPRNEIGNGVSNEPRNNTGNEIGNNEHTTPQNENSTSAAGSSENIAIGVEGT